MMISVAEQVAFAGKAVQKKPRVIVSMPDLSDNRLFLKPHL